MSQLEHVGDMLKDRREREMCEKQSQLAKAALELIAVTRHQGIPDEHIVKLLETMLAKFVLDEPASGA